MNRKTLAALLLLGCPVFGSTIFTPGNLVVAVEGNGVYGAASGPYTDNQAAPLTLFQYQVSGTSSASYVNSLALSAISGEYGSSSEGTLQLSGNGKVLTIMGYGVDAATFNQNPGAFSPDPANTALGQSGSVTGQAYTAVPRVVAVIDAGGNVNTSTAVYGVFNANNPRSAYTLDGNTIYISGQGTSGDHTGGVFVTQLGSNSAVSISGADAGSGAAQDARTVQIDNGTLYVSSDSKSGATNRDYIGTLGTAGTPPLGLANGGNGPAMLSGFGNTGGTGKLTVTAGNTNGINTIGSVVNLSPENYFFANASTLYVADSGSPKNTSGNSGLGDGGLQKWLNSNADGSGTWTLAYTLSAGLGLVPNTQADNPAGDDVTGLYGLTGMVAGNQVELYATSFTLGDADPTFLYGITDSLSATAPAQGESFTQLASAPADSTLKGVSFAPVSDTPEPACLVVVALSLLGSVALRRKRSSAAIKKPHARAAWS